VIQKVTDVGIWNTEKYQLQTTEYQTIRFCPAFVPPWTVICVLYFSHTE